MLATHIAFYVGAAIEHESERAVLVELVRLLEERGNPATVLINVNVEERQLDLVVGTDDLTLVLEAKASSAPLRGTVNGSWAALTRSGRWKTARNAYLQAIQAKNALRDAMREHQGEVTGYPNACVVFAPRLGVGSDIPADDLKVSFRGLDGIADQLDRRSQLCWSSDQWRSFAERHALDQVSDVTGACDRRMLEAQRTLEQYVGEFTTTYAPAVAQFKPDTYRADGKSLGVLDLERLLLQDRANLLIQGPSGCGKSMLSIWLASRLSAAGMIPVVVECRAFDGQLGVALDREAVLLDVRSAGRLFAASRMLSRSIVVIVDGYNECSAAVRFRLTRALRAASAKYEVAIVVSSQIEVDRPDLLPLRQVSVSAPSQELKVCIAALDPTAAETLAPLLQVITTGIEASLIGQMGREAVPTTSRFALFDTFVRRRLGDAASEGVILLCSIAELLFQRATFSLSVREVDRILAKQRLNAGVLARVREAGVLIARADRVSFVHEMFLNAFAAEAIVRQQGLDGDAMLNALSMPRFETLRTFIVGAIEDESLLAQLVGSTTDVSLLDACMTGECGSTAQQLIKDALGATLARLQGEVDRVRFDVSPPQMWAVMPTPESLTLWTEHERALLSVLSAAMHEGHWNQEMLDVVGRLDQKLAAEFSRLRPEAIEKGVKRLRTGLFAVCYVFGQRELGIAHTMSLLHGGGVGRKSRDRLKNGVLRHVWDEVVTPGQLYLALALSHPTFALEREVLEQAIECALPFLDTRRWKFVPYHLQLDLMNFVHFLPRGDSPMRERLSHVLEALLPELHPLLQGTAVEALTNLGAMDDEVAHHEAQVREEVAEVLRSPTTEEAATAAWGLFNAQFDHPFDIAYVEVIQSLPNDQRLTLLRLACAGASDGSFFLSSVIDQLTREGDALAIPMIARWARLPNPNSMMQQHSVEVFVTALIGLGQLGFDLPDEICRFGQEPREDAMSACGLLYFWLQRRSPDAAMAEHQVMAALDTLCAKPALSIGVLRDISWSMWGDSKGRGMQLVQAFPERMVAIARAALQHRGPLEGYFPGRHRTDPAEVGRFAVSILDAHGSAADLSLLRTFVDDVHLAGVARKALMSIEGRSSLPATRNS